MLRLLSLNLFLKLLNLCFCFLNFFSEFGLGVVRVVNSKGRSNIDFACWLAIVEDFNPFINEAVFIKLFKIYCCFANEGVRCSSGIPDLKFSILVEVSDFNIKNLVPLRFQACFIMSSSLQFPALRLENDVWVLFAYPFNITSQLSLNKRESPICLLFWTSWNH